MMKKSIKMKKTVSILIFTFTFLGCAQSVKNNIGKAEMPNIIFIFSDDLSFRDLSCYGQTNFSTPNIDKLVNQSHRFTQAYTGAPACAPSRGTLLTGMHVGHQPIRMNSSARGFEPLPAKLNTFPKMLQTAGYKTGVIGKWGLGFKNSTGNPLKQGFDYHFGYLTHYEAHSYFPLVLYENNEEIYFPKNNSLNMDVLYEKKPKKDNSKFEDYYNEEGKLVKINLEEVTYAPDLFDEKAISFIDKNKGNPFLLYFATNLPHGPAIVDDLRELNSKEMDINSKEWGAMVKRLDISTGKIIKKLKEEQLYDNSVIIFASDNGYAMHMPRNGVNGERIWDNNPDLNNKGEFKGGKFGVLEGGMRVPFAIKMPNQKESNIINTPVWLIDLFPTFAEMANVEVNHKLDGYSLVSLIKGNRESIPKDRFMYFYSNNEQAVRKGSWYAFRSHPKKNIKLYLIEEDQYLLHNLANNYPNVVNEMKQIMDTAHEPSEWYWNPGDSRNDFQNKRIKATKTGQLIKRYRPNNMELMPWEKK